VHRRQLDPGQSGGGRRREKGGAAEPADHALGRSRGGYGSKIHLVTDGRGTPLAVEVTAGQRHESTRFESVLTAVRVPRPVGRPRSRPNRVAGDKGYSYDRIRRWLRRRGIKAVIPQRSDQRARHRGRPLAFDKDAYRRRHVIECCIGWLKECRAVATRFEKLARHYLAMVKLAMIQRYFRILDSPYRA
jgi:transposase